MSDGPAPVGYPTLVGHRVAVIVFTVVVNKGDNIFNLTTAQLRDIFLGQITNWKQVNGVNLPISIVARTTASGTRRAFDQEVLGGRPEPPFTSYNCINGADSSIGDVEGHTYPFWTVEYLYTSGPPAAGGSLTSDFLGYMNNTTSSDILRAENYIPCVDRGQVNPLCR
jgi:phosphate transport system substrate-binding protein